MRKKIFCHCGGEVTVETKKHSKEFGVRVYFYCNKCSTFREIIAERKRDAIAAYEKAEAEAKP